MNFTSFCTEDEPSFESLVCLSSGYVTLRYHLKSKLSQKMCVNCCTFVRSPNKPDEGSYWPAKISLKDTFFALFYQSCNSLLD